MATEPTPTDAEIVDLWASYVGEPTDKLPLTDRDKVEFARAVIARWGVLRSDKIVIPTDTMEQEFQKHYRRGYEAGLRAQPAASPVPLTDEQAKALLKNSDLLDMFLHIGWYSAPRKNFDAHGLTLIRAIETAHGIGIKGAQHGADTK